MGDIEVKTGEYKIIEQQDRTVIYSENLGSDIAFTIFSIDLKKVGIGRNLNAEQIKNMFKEFNPDKVNEKILMDVQIIGGDSSEESRKQFDILSSMLQEIDDDKDIINIKSGDIDGAIYPNSFEIDCFHGGVREREEQRIEVLNLDFYKPKATRNLKTDFSKGKGGGCSIL